MVSRRNFISITIMMLTLLFMFQTTQVYYEHIAKDNRNEFIPDYVISGNNAWKPDVLDVTDANLREQYILFFGDKNGAVGNTVRQWCEYTKRNLVVCQDLNSFSGNIGKNQEYVLVESACLDIPSDLDALEEFAKAGIDIIFCDLPDVKTIRQNPQLQEMLGIRKIQQERVDADGIKLFSGFLLGGEVTYLENDDESKLRNNDLQMPWYQLAAGAQTYMIGLLETDEDIRREDLPALIWSFSDGNSEIFAINGDYLHDNTGIGILSAMDAKLGGYALYPILDAQLLTVANYPGIANENAEMLHKLFSGNMIQVGRDVVFPQLVATAEQTDFIMSCMLQTQYDYMDTNNPDAAALRDYIKLMKKAGAELGLSLVRKSETTLTQKLDADKVFFEQSDNQYLFGAVYSAQDGLKDIADTISLPNSINTIVATPNVGQDLISFGNDRLTIQSITSDASVYSFRSDLYMRSVQTALGYTNVLIDLNRVFWPEENELSWEKLSKIYADNLYTHWRNFQSFEDTTVSQSDQKIRQLLTMDYSHEQKDNVIYLQLENTEQSVSFVLRLHNAKPESVVGGTYTILEDGVYLIRTTAQSVEIHLTSSNPIHN